MKKVPFREKQKPSKTEDDAIGSNLLVPAFNALVETSGILTEGIEGGTLFSSHLYSVMVMEKHGARSFLGVRSIRQKGHTKS